MESLEDFLPIRPRGSKPVEVEEVNFQDPEKEIRKKRKLEKDEAQNNRPVDAEKPMKSSKYSKIVAKQLSSMSFEVRRFNTKSLGRKERLEAEREQLIQLGAKPPPIKGMNYKELIAKRKVEREKFKEEQMIARLQGLPVAKDPTKLTGASRKKKNARAKEMFGSERFDKASDGQIGTYDRGFQRISSSDLKRIKNHKTLNF